MTPRFSRASGRRLRVGDLRRLGARIYPQWSGATRGFRKRGAIPRKLPGRSLGDAQSYTRDTCGRPIAPAVSCRSNRPELRSTRARWRAQVATSSRAPRRGVHAKMVMSNSSRRAGQKAGRFDERPYSACRNRRAGNHSTLRRGKQNQACSTPRKRSSLSIRLSHSVRARDEEGASAAIVDGGASGWEASSTPLQRAANSWLRMLPRATVWRRGSPWFASDHSARLQVQTSMDLQRPQSPREFKHRLVT